MINSTKLSTFTGPITLTQPVSTSGSPTALTITGAAHTTLTASTEATDVNFNLARTVQFATGALTTQRAMRIQAPTYSFVGASTITTASTLSISGPPAAGTNATITNAYALNVESGHVNCSSSYVYASRVYVGDAYFATTGAYAWEIRSTYGKDFAREGGGGLFAYAPITAPALASNGSQNGCLDSSVITIGKYGMTGTTYVATALDAAIYAQKGGAYNATTYSTSRKIYLVTFNGGNAVSGNSNGGDGGSVVAMIGAGGTGTGSGVSGANGTFEVQTAAGTMLTRVSYDGALAFTNETFDQRNSTTAQTFRLAGTWTSTTSYERINIKGKASANFEIGPENGSAGGTLRGLTIGGYSAGSSTITPWMSFTGSTGELGIFGNGVVRQSKYGDDATAAIYAFRKYRGTESVPTEIQSGDTIGQILFQGYHGGSIGTSAAIQAIATDTFTSAPNRPTRMAFNTTAAGDTQSSIRMTITDVGTTWFGSYNSSYTNAGLVGIAGNNQTAAAENNTLLFRDNGSIGNVGQVLGKIAFWSSDGSSPGAGVKAWISCISESAFVANSAIIFGTDTTTGTPSERMRITSGGNVGIGTGSTVSAKTHILSTTEQLRLGYDSGDYFSTTVSSTGAVTFDAAGSAPLFAFSKLVGQSAAEITNTPAATTQTITLDNGNHQTLTLTSATGAVAVTLTVPSKVSSGTIIVKQHATTPRNITWAVSAGTIKWMGTQPTWSSDAVNDIRIVSWRYDGSVMYLMSTDKAA